MSAFGIKLNDAEIGVTLIVLFISFFVWLTFYAGKSDYDYCLERIVIEIGRSSPEEIRDMKQSCHVLYNM